MISLGSVPAFTVMVCTMIKLGSVQHRRHDFEALGGRFSAGEDITGWEIV